MSTAAPAEATVSRLAVAIAVVVIRVATSGRWLFGRRREVEGAAHDRFAVVSHAVPPMWSGQAMVLERLLGMLPAEQAVVIATARAAPADSPRNTTVVLPSEPWEARWSQPGWWATLTVFYRCVLRGWRIAQILRRERCGGVVACTGDLIDLPASMLACRALRLPLVAYYFDDYVAQWSWAPAAFARSQRFEPLILQTARHVLVPNERLAACVAQRSGTRPMIIRNPAWTDEVPELPQAAGDPRAPCRIVYTGAVYHVNYAAFRCLIASFAELADVQPELHLYTAQDPAQLAEEGIQGPGVHLFSHVDPGEAWARQREAGIVFMGFAFDDRVAAIVQTSAPGKLGDYLASGVPILAVAPSGSFLIDYLREHACGEVIETLDPHAVAQAIRRLAGDAGRREILVTNALTSARREFAASVAVKELLNALGLESRAEPRHEAIEQGAEIE